MPTTWWNWEDAGHNDEAKKELKELFPHELPFETPKPVRLLKRVIQIACRPDGQDLVLDFFAGSATTAQAVWELNRQDGGDRRFILAQLSDQESQHSKQDERQMLTFVSVLSLPPLATRTYGPPFAPVPRTNARISATISRSR